MYVAAISSYAIGLCLKECWHLSNSILSTLWFPGHQMLVCSHASVPSVTLSPSFSSHSQDLISHVGIHPTVGEEFTTLFVAKSSGASIAKTGC